jgi:hypothetical protein
MSTPWPDHDEPGDDDLLTPWEREFMASIGAWEGELTDAQQSKLDEIEQLLEERREQWRQGWRLAGDSPDHAVAGHGSG